MVLGYGIRKKPIPDPGSRGQKGTGYRIPDPDPQHCSLLLIRYGIGQNLKQNFLNPVVSFTPRQAQRLFLREQVSHLGVLAAIKHCRLVKMIGETADQLQQLPHGNHRLLVFFSS
jgi:hypothetical protein